MRASLPLRFAPLALCLALLGLAPAHAADPVAYTLRFPHRAQHYVEVSAVIPTGGADTVELMLPVWTPGSYLVRDYARHLEGLTVDGEAAGIKRTAKNRWRVPTGGKRSVEVRYRLYGRLLTVRTNYVAAEFALVIGAATFLTPLDLKRRYTVRVERPKGWRHVVTGLPADGPDRFRADDYDHLVDSPILVGNPTLSRFEVAGVPHLLADLGGDGLWDSARAAADVRKIVAEQQRFWGGPLPYRAYSFLNLLVETGGGLEHLNSTVIMSSRFAQRDRAAYINWLRLVAHEFFHTWNVKRLRPVELGPFDYERENHTRSLWIAEGITSYFDSLTVRRAGLSADKDLFGALSKKIERVQTTPGRAVRSLEDASFDAWIKFYKPDENSRNVAPSYYVKGAVVAFLLDMTIRRRTQDARSLDDVLRAAWTPYSGAKGFTTEEFAAVASAVAGVDLSDFFARYTAGTAELDYGPALAWVGLRFKPAKSKKKKTKTAGDARDEKTPAWLGAQIKPAGGRVMVRTVPRDTPAHAAGLNAEDEIIAIDDQRVPASGFETRLARYRAGERVRLLVARRGRLVRLPITFGAKPEASWTIEVDPDATPAQVARRTAWLSATAPRSRKQ